MIYLESEEVEQIMLFHNFFTVQSRIFFTELMITLLIPEVIFLGQILHDLFCHLSIEYQILLKSRNSYLY